MPVVLQMIEGACHFIIQGHCADLADMFPVPCNLIYYIKPYDTVDKTNCV